MECVVYGAGYVGLIQAIGLNRSGFSVTLIDIDEARIGMLRERRSPIHEAGVDVFLASHDDTFTVSTLPRLADVVFVAVGTPTKDGVQDDFALFSVMDTIADLLKEVSYAPTIVIKSTVLPGTTDRVGRFLEERSGKEAGKDFFLAMNPEFLREGTALQDFFGTSRVVIGSQHQVAQMALRALYAFAHERIVVCSPIEAEMVKYASNSFLAAKISFANDIGNLCKAIGADPYEVLRIVGMDPRIGPAFLASGVGYGGSCFPKDVSAICAYAKTSGVPLNVVEGAKMTNDSQVGRLVAQAKERYDLAGMRIGVLGVAFKPGTDDVREAPALRLFDMFKGHDVVAHDPAAKVPSQYSWVRQGSIKDVLGCDIVFVMTEWDEYCGIEFGDVPAFLGRRIDVKGGVVHGITW